MKASWCGNEGLEDLAGGKWVVRRGRKNANNSASLVKKLNRISRSTVRLQWGDLTDSNFFKRAASGQIICIGSNGLVGHFDACGVTFVALTSGAYPMSSCKLVIF